MSWFGRKRNRDRDAAEISDVVVQYLTQFVKTRRGVEAWIEQPTNFNKPSILLVAADGESTRRGIPSAEFGYDLADELDIPCYDAGVVPYPQRMREYGKQARRSNRT